VIPIKDWAEGLLVLLEDYDLVRFGTANFVLIVGRLDVRFEFALGIGSSRCRRICPVCQQGRSETAQGKFFWPRAASFVPTNTPHNRFLSWLMGQIIVDKEFIPDNCYYTVPVPWLQVKLLQLIQLFPVPEERALRAKLEACLDTIFRTANDVPKNIQHHNALQAVFLVRLAHRNLKITQEAIRLAVKVDSEANRVTQATMLLGRYIASKEANMRYLGLDALIPMASLPSALPTLQSLQSPILANLQDKDISVRRRGLDLVFVMTDSSNAKAIVTELLTHIGPADFAFRDDLVLKIAVLVEKHATEPSYYVDVILHLLASAGDHVCPEIWHRLVQLVTNTPSLHSYAANAVLQLLSRPSCHENSIKVAAYLLGEYADLLPSISPIELFRMLHRHFGIAPISTKSMLLTSYAKLTNLFPEIRQDVVRVLEAQRSNLDGELQQRAIEYLALLDQDSVMGAVFEPMPVFSNRTSAVVRRLERGKEEAGRKREKRDVALDAASPKRTQIANQTSTLPLSAKATVEQGLFYLLSR
jgi:AP-2 complex subunit alpha